MTKAEILQELQEKTAIPGVLPTWLQPIQTRIVMLQSGFRAMMGVKVYGSEFFVELYRLLGEVVGQASLVSRHSPVGQVAKARIERLYRTSSILTFGGGANEVQRDIIAMAGMGLPHYKT